MNRSLCFFRFVVLSVLICAIGFVGAFADSGMLDWQGKRIAFENAVATGDNPWGFTAGLIDEDDGSQHLFLTPNTAVTVYDLLGDGQLALQFRVHPWVAESSDGAGILVWLQDDDENIVKEDFISVDNSGNWMPWDVDLSSHAGVTRIKLLCNNGGRGDDGGDWVEIQAGSAVQGEDVDQSADWQGLNVIFEGGLETDDNPWGFTAALIDANDGGRQLFLTPNTAATFNAVKGKLSLEFRIHPWVAENSDGAGMLVWMLDRSENIVYEESIPIDAEAVWVEKNWDLTQYPGVTRVKLLCNNGVNDDDSDDWVVVRLGR